MKIQFDLLFHYLPLSTNPLMFFINFTTICNRTYSKWIFFFCLAFFSNGTMAQVKNPYTYQDLSNLFYAKQRDSIKKNWVCPNIYSEKATQKKYKEIWDTRTEFITSAIEAQNFIHETEVYNYVNDILKELAAGSPKLIPEKPILFLDRSSSVNAYAIGGNIIAVNLGLILFANTREEVAMVISHELSHNILDHAGKSMKEKAEWLTSEEYKNSLNAVLDSKYERLTKLKRIFEGYSFSRSKHSRYHESDADSLGIILMKNSHLSFDPEFFLRLDSADIQYRQPLQNPVSAYFTKYTLPFEDWWTKKATKGLSTRNYNFKDNEGIEDSLKTHPDCKDRYTNTLAQAGANKKKTAIPKAIKEISNKMVIWNMFDNLSLTACLYRLLQEKDKGNTDQWYDFMIHNIFSGLFYSDKQLNRFHAIGVTPKKFISKDYYELQNMLEQMPRESLEQYCKQLDNGSFWQGMPSDAKALKALMHTLNVDSEDTDKKSKIAAKEFAGNNPTSMYCEFADHFKSK